MDHWCKGMAINPQVGMENSLVRESQAKGWVNDVILRIQGQINVRKLNLEAHHTIWP